ncbi:MAG: hypothetical protein M1836_001926 [Candelina mexicana]|nr:MAG: hypothetical protein M1836_001926 [Candelina mexicana]
MILTVDRIVYVPVPKEVPTEILVRIFSYLHKDDIKCVRQICRDFVAASAQYLFDRLYVSPQELHLEILTAVSQHPIFSKYVREIVYHCSQFRSGFLLREAYEKEHVRLAVFKCRQESEMDEWHSRSCQHYDQQEDLIKADADSNAFYEALSKMP